jgi:hypothetical protein
MSLKIVNIISLTIIIILFQISFQNEYINLTNKINIPNFTNISLDFNKSNKTSDKLAKMRKLLSDQNENEDIIVSESNVPALLFELFDQLALFLYDYNLTDLLEVEEVETCFFDGILENVQNQKLLDIYITGSGKSLNDFGNEYICDYKVRRNVSYLTLHFFLGTNNYTSDKEEFFGQDYFYIGLCLPRKCMNATQYLIQNLKVLNICHEVGLSNFKLYTNEEVINLSDRLSNFYSVFILIYILLIGLKFLVGIWRVIFLNKGYEGYLQSELEEKEIQRINTMMSTSSFNTINEVKNISDNTQDEKTPERANRTRSYEKIAIDYSSSYNSDINESIISEDENLYNPFEDKVKNFPLLMKILKWLDLFDNIKVLSTNSNKYYNSKNIKSLYIIRFFLMLMFIIHQMMYTQIYLPTKNFYNVEFYSHNAFILVKFCINASIFWITLDAVFFGYKLMSYLKKEIKLSRNFEISYLTFLKFLLLILPKFFLFLFAFILLHLYSNRLTFELCKINNVFSNYLYYNDTIQQMSYSLRNNNNPSDFFKHFIPFRLNYIDFIENITIVRNDKPKPNEDFITDVSRYEIPSPFLTNTDLFVNICFNEFYLIIIILIITYISYKIKNQIFDYAVLIINAILYILPAITSLNPFKGNIEDKHYTLIYVLGQNYSEKYTHYFINFFYFGFLLGVMKFYLEHNRYNMKKKKNIFTQIYLPFQFCQKLITFVKGINICIKRTILLCCLFFLLLISSSFNLAEGNKFSYDKDMDFVNLKGIVKFLFFYEKNLSGIFFFLFLLIYICIPKHSKLMQIAESTTFIIMERISFSFLISFSYLIYAQFCVFIISIQMSYSNLFFNAVGMFFIAFIFSLLNTALLELPIRQLIKHYMNRNIEKKYLDYLEKSNTKISDDIPSRLNTKEE